MKCPNCNKNQCASGRKTCNTCKSRAWIDKNKIRYAWHMLKKSAKKRKLPFTLTLDYFTKVCVDTGYIEKKGRLMNDFTIDRINGDLGYHNDNILVVTKSFNSSKYHSSDETEMPF